MRKKIVGQNISIHPYTHTYVFSFIYPLLAEQKIVVRSCLTERSTVAPHINQNASLHK